MVKITYPVLKPTIDNKFILQDDYIFEDVTIKKGYVTNGADIPRIFWSIIPPFKPKYLPAVIVHDFLFENKEYEKGNLLFEKILLEIEKSIATKTMIKSVKIYTKIKYGVWLC